MADDAMDALLNTGLADEAEAFARARRKPFELDTTDPQVWASEFMTLFNGRVISDAYKHDVVDTGTMLDWFTNAIRRGRNASESIDEPEKFGVVYMPDPDIKQPYSSCVDHVHVVDDDGWYTATRLQSSNWKTFDNEAEAHEFMKTWKGHPWYFERKLDGPYEVVKLVANMVHHGWKNPNA